MLARGRVITSRYGLTAGKMDTALALFTEILRESACSATFPVTASTIALNPGLAKKYVGKGLELAVHGLQHIDYSRLSLEEQVSHLRLARDIYDKLGIPVRGFRCPYLRWNNDLITAVRDSGFTYDGSQAMVLDVVGGGMMTDAYRRALDFYGAQSANAYPALPDWSDGLVRIPYCLPDDEALVDRLHITEASVMAEIWLAMLDLIYQTGELFTLGLHPERTSVCKGALQALLTKAHSLSPSVWIARLDEIASWYLALGKATFDYRQEDNNLYHLSISAPAGATTLLRSLKALTVTHPWAQGYHTVVENEFILQSTVRPWIGLSPGSPTSLERFLRHQGYLVEISSESTAYTYYLDRNSFNQQDERALLADLECENLPLVRLSRWPNGARCGLAITGDVDALTIWDYGRRLFY